jgi:hypothetical protein
VGGLPLHRRAELRGRWSAAASRVFIALFLLLWLVTLALFLAMTSAHNGGTAERTAIHTVAFTQHNNTKFITTAQQERIELLLRFLFVGGGVEACLGLTFLLVFRSSPLGPPPRPAA